MSEIDAPLVTDPETLVPIRGPGTSTLDRWIESDPERAIKLIETRVRLLETLRVASIRATYPSDWIIHTSLDSAGQIISQRGYLQDIGAERAGKIWGVEVGSPAIEYKDFPDGTFGWWMIAEAWSKTTGERLEYVEGARWSGDRFFARSIGADEKIDPVDVRKSAWANLHGRAVRALTGLNGVPVEMLRQAGLDITKVVMVSYEKGAKGGESTGAGVGSADAVVAFGNSKGKRPAELADKDLDWYIRAYGENVADERKAQYRKANQRVLDALTAERERRGQAAAHEAATGTKAPEPTAGASGSDDAAERPTSRGRKLGDLHVRLTDAAKGDGKKVAPLLRLLMRDRFGVEKAALSELTDEELDACLAVPDEGFALLVTALGKAGAK